MSTAELCRDRVLWAAYTRGCDDRTAVFRTATNLGPTPAITDRSRSPRRPVQLAGTPRPPPMPQSTRLLQLPPQPLMPAPVPRTRSSIPPAPPTTNKMDQKSAQWPSPAPKRNSRQRRNQARMREHRRKKKTAEPTTSQQFRLEKPALPTIQPAPGPKSLEAANTPVPEAKAQATATSIPVDMEISLDEEAELLCGMDVGPPR
ncbi:uncharacterized protein LOC132925126 [Rhopalosiphum padi]|uniref:uncharacterized protein LOC132925126 n=1 Tax=Rhopalosiphum padi TaxID=40932 RepID=UPI00298E6856|nr:uncharacterized protein LOC132925126 [Rhopalosiphum padi]